jgi:hypothetical protein
MLFTAFTHHGWVRSAPVDSQHAAHAPASPGHDALIALVKSHTYDAGVVNEEAIESAGRQIGKIR